MAEILLGTLTWGFVGLAELELRERVSSGRIVDILWYFTPILPFAAISIVSNSARPGLGLFAMFYGVFVAGIQVGRLGSPEEEPKSR